MSKRRPLSDEERALWSGLARSIKPLGRTKTSTKQTASAAGEAPAAPLPAPVPHAATRPVAAPAMQSLPLAPFDRRLKQRVARGHDAIDARFDLHGLTQSEAHAALLRFLRRAQADGACVILGSATPSLESRYNAEREKYTLIELPGRIEARPMPTIELIDMREEFLETRQQATFSRKLIEALGARMENGEQTIVLLNRRGFSSFVACRACGERINCQNCSLTLTYHKRDRRLMCHYCGYAEKVPSLCPKCQSEHIYFLGVGSEKVEEELHRAFPVARIARLDRDTVTGKRQYETILNEFREGNYDVLVGTQMIAKGHDIPNVTLVGVVSADIGLGMPDFRAAERTFQLLTQVAGRAGRGSVPGIVLIQTINPDHYAVRMAAAQDYQAFYQKELHFRRMMHYPPFSAMANVLVRAEKKENALRMSSDLGLLLNPAPEKLKIMGPAEAPVPRLKNEYRYQFLVKAASRKVLNDLLRRIRAFALENKWGATALVIDVDPLTLM